MTNGRVKGSVAEREVAGMLAAWWRTIEPAAEFVRTPLSGGWSTPTVRSGFRASGDIMTTSPTFPFAVEVKRREGFAWSTLLAGRASPVWGWWGQATKAAREQGGTPMLWLKHNGEPWRVIVPVGFLEGLGPLFPRRFAYAKRLSFPEGGEVSIVAARALLAVPAARVADLLPVTGR